MEFTLWNSISGPFLYLLHAPRPSPPQDVWHRPRRRVSAAGQYVALVDPRLSHTVLVDPTAGSLAVQRLDATHVDSSALAATHSPAGLVAGDGPELFAPTPHAESAPLY